MASIISAGTTSGTSLNLSGDTSGVLQLASNGSTTAVTIDTNQRAAFVAGTDALPVITTTGDTNTGIFFPAADTVAASTGGSERMRITSAGYVKASNNGTYQSSTGDYHEFRNTGQSVPAIWLSATNASYDSTVIQLRASRNTTDNSFYAIQYFNTGASASKFQVADSGNVTNTNNSYGSISDIKLKENIVDATPKLNKLCEVQVRNFNIIGDEQKQLGVVAQELEQIFPSMIEESPDKDIDGNDLGTTTKLVKYSVFVPMLIKAVQELNAKVEAQAVRIAELEGAR
jgi:hypothetical protein